MEHGTSDWSKWLTTATQGIRFGPDQKAVRAELEAHLEDKTADFQRIFPDMTAEEAEDRAVSEMGDPAELGKELARVHRPWLGYLWQASKWAAGLLAAAYMLVCVVNYDDYQSLGGPPLWGGTVETRYTAPPERAPESVELGGYTFRIMEAVAKTPDVTAENSAGDRLYVVLRVSTPRFWEPFRSASLFDALVVTTEDGGHYPMEEKIFLGEMQMVARTIRRIGWGFFHQDIEISVHDCEALEAGERIRLEFNFSAGEFALSAQVMEEMER